MPISIDWATRVIYVPQSYLAVVSARDYSLDLNQFRLDLRALEWSDTFGWASDPTHRHIQPITLAGVTYGRTVEIVNGYTVEFQQAAQPYRVSVLGGNHNISDVQVINTVSLVIGNSAGLVQVAAGGGGGSAPTPAQNAAAVWAHSQRTLTGVVPANVMQVNNVPVAGTGVAGVDPWRPA